MTTKTLNKDNFKIVLSPFTAEVRMLCLTIISTKISGQLIDSFYESKGVKVEVEQATQLEFVTIGGKILANLCGISQEAMPYLKKYISGDEFLKGLGFYKINPSYAHIQVAKSQNTLSKHCSVSGVSLSNAVFLALTSNPEFVQFYLSNIDFSYSQDFLQMITKGKKFNSRNQFAADWYDKPVFKRRVLSELILPNYSM